MDDLIKNSISSWIMMDLKYFKSNIKFEHFADINS